MKICSTILLGVLVAWPFACYAQEDMPDAPTPQSSAHRTASPVYTPPTQGERLKGYLKATYGIQPVIEAAIRGGLEQKRDRPSEWPQGAQGYADRFGSAMGQIAIRGTTEYVASEVFREDLRFIPCRSPCTQSVFTRALEDTFTARRGEDGHRSFSVARMIGPISGAAVATNTWYPAGYGGSEIAKQAGLSYGLIYLRSLIKEARAH